MPLTVAGFDGVSIGRLHQLGGRALDGGLLGLGIAWELKSKLVGDKAAGVFKLQTQFRRIGGNGSDIESEGSILSGRNVRSGASAPLPKLPSDAHLFEIREEIAVFHIQSDGRFVDLGIGGIHDSHRGECFFHIPELRFFAAPSIEDSPASVADGLVVLEVKGVVDSRPDRKSEAALGFPDAIPQLQKTLAPEIAESGVCGEFEAVVGV